MYTHIYINICFVQVTHSHFQKICRKVYLERNCSHPVPFYPFFPFFLCSVDNCLYFIQPALLSPYDMIMFWFIKFPVLLSFVIFFLEITSFFTFSRIPSFSAFYLPPQVISKLRAQHNPVIWLSILRLSSSQPLW